MKIVICILSLTLSSIVHGGPCNGAPGKYFVNPDGSNGGFIENGAWVEKSNYISIDSEICDKAIVKGNNQILDGSSIRENAIIEGSVVVRDSQIYESAQVKGKAVVLNSEICQGSKVEGIKVFNSKYYCQKEDPQPKDPGEEGKKTLLGVDSDGDGVRDDVEVFINNTLSNTVLKNYAEERIASKLFAKMYQMELLLAENKTSIFKIGLEKIDLLNCYKISKSTDIFIKMFNTEQRLLKMFKVKGYYHGRKADIPSKSCKTMTQIHENLKRIN